jgi:hypothetical protein
LGGQWGRGGGGGDFPVSDTQRKFKNQYRIPAIAWRFGHEGLVKTKIFNDVVKRASFKNF